jgi:hypothetical protein
MTCELLVPIIAFIHIKKTAGKAIKHIMRREFGMRHCDVKRWQRSDPYFSATDLIRLSRVYPRLASIAGHSIKPHSDLREAAPNLRYYTFLREPIARSISQFQYRVKMKRSVRGSFEEWICDPSYHNLQVQSLVGAPDLDRALRLLEQEIDFVGLTEWLDESLALMKQALALPDIDLSSNRVNAAKEHSIRDKLRNDPRCLKLLREANALDIALYNHVKDVIYPRQRALFSAGVAAGSESRGRTRYSAQWYVNASYRQLVYKPVVWAYRTVHPIHHSG